MKRLLNWLIILDKNLLKILVGLLIFLIPLYPKLPLRMVNFTYIAIRVEDIYLAFLTTVFFIYLIRKKVLLPKNWFLWFCLYWLAVFISTIWGIYYGKTIEINHLGFLHALRRIEYMIVFFICFSVIKKSTDFIFFLKLHLISLLLVGIYGVGQKFLGWPAVQTMNPEYAKGYLLFLTPEARISSTFAGHYDLASYLVFFIPIIWGFFFQSNQRKYLLLYLVALVTLILTGSRISLIAYFLSLFPFLLILRKFRYFVFALLVTAVFVFSSDNLTSRLKRTFQVKKVFVDQSSGHVIVPQKIRPEELPAGSFVVNLGKTTQNNQDTNQQQNISKQTPVIVNFEEDKLLKQKIIEDIRKEAESQGKTLSPDEEEMLFASIAAKLKPVTTVVTDISFSTRLQVEWPRAIRAFLKNPILGTGPSSITEATDNGYLRTLGEFGLLASTIFFLIVLKLIKTVWFFSRKSKNFNFILWGYLSGLFALLVNTTYIDVFEASKMAYTFWGISGLISGLITISYEKEFKKT